MAQSDIVTVADYQQQTTLEAGGATLLRIVGQITCASTTPVTNVIAYGIFIRDDQLVPAVGFDTDPMNVNGIISGACLWRWQVMTPLSQDVVHIPFDIRVKRKLEDSVITLVGVTAAGGVGVVWTYGARALIKGG